MRRFAGNILLGLAGMALALAIGEIVCRKLVRPPTQVVVEDFSMAPAADPRGADFEVTRSPDTLFQYTRSGGVRLAPSVRVTVTNHHVSGRDVEFVTNDLGLRGAPVPKEKGTDYRILVLGDSITMGDHVPEAETYPVRLETHLRRWVPTARVVNGGIGSADIRNEYAVLNEVGLLTEPDLVLIGLYLNDGELSANVLVPPLPGWLKWSYFASFLYRKGVIASYRWGHRDDLAGAGREWIAQFVGGRKLAEGDWRSDREAFDWLVVKNARDWGAAWDQATWRVIEETLLQFKSLAAARGFRLAVLLFPVRYQVESDFPADMPQRSFAEVTGRLGLQHLDLLPLLRSAWQADPARPLFHDKCHLTAEGYDLVARAAADFLAEKAVQ